MMKLLRNYAGDVLLFILWVCLSASLMSANADIDAAREDRPDRTIELAFTTFRDAGLPDQDVYLQHEPESSEVFRPTAADTDMDAPLFRSAVPVRHDPFDDAAVGPHRKGKPFGMTLGQWLQHHGEGSYTCAGGEATLALTFAGLVPRGVYTMWYASASKQGVGTASGLVELPLPGGDGTNGYFTADESGNASFSRKLGSCLQPSDVWSTSLLGINYHSDNKTYGGSPGDYGYNAHVALIAALPRR